VRRKKREGPVHGPQLPDKDYVKFQRAVAGSTRRRGRWRTVGSRGGLSGTRWHDLHDHRKGVDKCRACQSDLRKAPTQVHLGRAWGKLFMAFLGFVVFVAVLYFLTAG